MTDPQAEETVVEKSFDLFVVNTGFDFSLKENVSMQDNGISKRGCYEYTEIQRQKAETAVTPLSLSDLEAKVSALCIIFESFKSSC